MPLANQITAGFQRVGQEMKALRNADSPGTPVNWWAPPSGILTAGATLLTASLLNQIRLNLIWVPGGWTIDTLATVVTSAHAGTQPTLTVGVYPSIADGSRPDMTNGPLYSGTYTSSSTGNRQVSLGPLNVTGAGAIFYMAHHMTYSTAPTTFPTVHTLTNVVMQGVSNPSSSTTVNRGLTVTGQTSMGAIANPTFSPVTDNQSPILWARRGA